MKSFTKRTLVYITVFFVAVCFLCLGEANAGKKKKKGWKSDKPSTEVIWRNPGLDPANIVTEEDVVEAINGFRLLPAEVKPLLIAAYREGRSVGMNISDGARFTEQYWGTGLKNVRTTDFGGKKIPAKAYAVEWNGSVYYLVDPEICHNLGWFSQEKQQEPQVSQPQPKSAPAPVAQAAVVPPSLPANCGFEWDIAIENTVFYGSYSFNELPGGFEFIGQ